MLSFASCQSEETMIGLEGRKVKASGKFIQRLRSVLLRRTFSNRSRRLADRFIDHLGSKTEGDLYGTIMHVGR